MKQLARVLFAISLLTMIFQSAVKGKQTKVFILAGQSNMEGQGVVSMDHEQHYNSGKGNLEWSMKHSATAPQMKNLKDSDGQWVVRNDVAISFKANDKVRKGGLTVGYTGYGGSSHIGPELQFGHVMGNFFKEPVLLIKTAWGGKSLYVDFRPPSSKGEVGPYYTRMMEEVRAALAQLENQEYEIAGFVWQQGWNDMCTEPAIPEYADNLVNLVNDVRTELGVPDLPVVIGELGNGGPTDRPGPMREFRTAQREGAKRIKNAIFVETVEFARPKELSPNVGHGHHWFGNAESYFLIGGALAEGMKKLLANQQDHSTTAEEVVFADQFDGELSADWEWLREHAAHWCIRDDALEIRVVPGKAKTVKNALLRKAPDRSTGTYRIEVDVTNLSEPTQQYEQAGITFYHNGKPAFKFVKELVNGEVMMIPGRKLVSGKSVQLRLTVTADSYTAQFRTDKSGEFQTASSGKLPPPGKDQISIQCYDGPSDQEHWIRFDNFRIVKIAN